jgi:uncharacterized protein (TIGR04255 family)
MILYLQTMQNPIEVKICPIVDAVLEIRFQSTVPASAVFGIIYGAIYQEFDKTETLPIMQIPEPLRETDPNFKFKGHYKLTNKDGYSLQIGPDVLVFGSIIPYQGWPTFSDFFYPLLHKILELNIISNFTRLGQRVINLFENVVHTDFKINLEIINKDISPLNVIIRTEHINESFVCVLQYSTNTEAINNGRQIKGHLVDIDISKELDSNFRDNFKQEIEKSHNIEKELFFSLLEQNLLDRLQPTYE